MFAVGLFQVGAPVKAGLETVVFPHFTVGCVIAVPAIPVAAKPVQVKLYVGVPPLLSEQETSLYQYWSLTLPPCQIQPCEHSLPRSGLQV